jgi:hypothetical protein
MEDMTGILAIVLIFGTPLLIALVIALFVSFNNQQARAERERARRLFERLIDEKLDVIKTAVAMGFSRDDLSYLDQRLEQLIGTEQMQTLLDSRVPRTPPVNTEMQQADLDAELSAMRQQQEDQPQE